MKHHSIVDFESLLELIKLESVNPGSKVSIYFSIPHESNFAIKGKAELKALIQKAARKMTFHGANVDMRLKIEASLESLIQNASLWEHRADGYVIFASSSILRYFVVPRTFESIASVGDEFDIRPLVPLLSYPEHFYAIEVSLGAVQLMRVLPDLVVPMQLDCPESIDSFRSENVPIAERNFHTTRINHKGGNRGMVVPHGSSQDEKHNEIERYSALLAKAVDRALAVTHDKTAHDHVDHGRAGNPLIVTGAKDLVRHFLRHLKHQSTIVSMEDLKLPEIDQGSMKAMREAKSLWQRCAALYEESYSAREQQTALLAYRAFDGTGRTSHDLAEIEQYAEAGQISTLIVSESDERFASDEVSSSGLLNKAIIATLRNRGEVIEAAHHDWLNDVHTAAILRPGAMPFRNSQSYAGNFAGVA